ncbi:MAG: hypothetical protein NZ455_11780 [Bacteroidia bacterium]|nr:hypothetical protein [Bacteroidia bacterium]
MRDTEHAVRQCEAPSVSVVRSSPTRAQRGTRPKRNNLNKIKKAQKVLCFPSDFDMILFISF